MKPFSKDDSDQKSSSAKPFRKFKTKDSTLILENIIGFTTTSPNSMALNKNTGELAYPAGSIIVIYNPILNKKSKFITSPNKRSFSCLTYSKDGKFLIGGEGTCKNPEINIWDLRHDNPPVTLKGHKFGIEILLFSPDNRYLVSIGDDNDKGLFVWDWEKEVKLSLNKLSKKINAAKFNDKGTMLVTAGNQHLKLWPFDDNGNIILAKPKESDAGYIIEGKPAHLGVKFKDKDFNDIAIHENLIYALESHGILLVLNETGKLEKWMDLKVQSAYGLQVSSSYIICGCSDATVRFFQPSTLSHIITLPKPPPLGAYNVEKGIKLPSSSNKSNEIYADCIAILLDEVHNRLVAIYSDRTMFISDITSLEKAKIVRSFLSHSSTIHDIQTLENSSLEVTFYATGSVDQTVRIWNLVDEEEERQNISLIKLPGLRRNLYTRNLSKILYMGEKYDHFKNNANPISPEKQVRCLKCSHDGQYLAVGDQDGVLKVFSLVTFSKVKEVTSHNQEILCLDFTPENPENNWFLASGSRDRLIHVYNVNRNFEFLVSIDDHNASISALKFAYLKSKGSLILVSCGADKSLIFREFKGIGGAGGGGVGFIQYHVEIDKFNKFFTLDVNHDSNIAVLGQEKKIQFWSLEDCKLKNVIETKEEDKNSGKAIGLDNLRVAVDGSGSYVAVSNSDKVVRIRDFASGNIVAKASCGDITTSLCFAMNSKQLITVTAKGCIYIWKLSQEIKSNIEKKKQQLGLLGRHLKEVLGRSRDLTLDSFWIEEELKLYLKRDPIPIKHIQNEPSPVLHEEDQKKKQPTQTSSNSSKNIEKEGKDMKRSNEEIKEEIIETISPLKMIVSQIISAPLPPPELFTPSPPPVQKVDPSEVVNTFMLPAWAQSKIDNIKNYQQEIKNMEINKQKEKDDICLESINELEFDQKINSNNNIINPNNNINKRNEAQNDMEVIEIQKSQGDDLEEEKEEEELYAKNKEAETITEEQDPFLKNNYTDLDNLENNPATNTKSPLRNSLTNKYYEQSSYTKPISNFSSTEKNSKVFEFIRDPKDRNRKSVFDINEIEGQVMMINKKMEEAELNLGKKTCPSIFESQVVSEGGMMKIERKMLVERKIDDIILKDNVSHKTQNSISSENLPKNDSNMELFKRIESNQLERDTKDAKKLIEKLNQDLEKFNSNLIDFDIEEEPIVLPIEKEPPPLPKQPSPKKEKASTLTPFKTPELSRKEEKEKSKKVLDLFEIPNTKSTTDDKSKETERNRRITHLRPSPEGIKETPKTTNSSIDFSLFKEVKFENERKDKEDNVLIINDKLSENKLFEKKQPIKKELADQNSSVQKEKIPEHFEEISKIETDRSEIKLETDRNLNIWEINSKVDESFSIIAQEIMKLQEIYRLAEVSNIYEKDQILTKIDNKLDETKLGFERISTRRTNNSMFLKSVFEDNSVVHNENNNKSLSHLIVDQSRDLLETYSKQLIGMIQEGLRKK